MQVESLPKKMVDLKWGHGARIKLITNKAKMASYHGLVGKFPKNIPFVIIKKLAIRDQILCRFEKEHLVYKSSTTPPECQCIKK